MVILCLANFAQIELKQFFFTIAAWCNATSLFSAEMNERASPCWSSVCYCLNLSAMLTLILKMGGLNKRGCQPSQDRCPCRVWHKFVACQVTGVCRSELITSQHGWWSVNSTDDSRFLRRKGLAAHKLYQRSAVISVSFQSSVRKMRQLQRNEAADFVKWRPPPHIKRTSSVVPPLVATETRAEQQVLWL